ncbi:hypothetical protein [Lepagella muris]|uniref:Uncharacterized protein n=1 Tax=Lepagella muris TaxID=3032870 RepID=A0AC61RL00_9BACT|nr:hypothetical protein [Lepagella muris]ROT09425.1 hypothetical protein EEL33_03240 [Muribaculaceae bacterium Isolate-037 (Harlan)]TGY78125.1 hypothetical protein E5331_11395 [Lepagella muris]THG51684.1 hypothetical protein E5984_10220 [Bacteroidales bacterium]TKC56986.1 hypothetical protein E5359_012365 [Bacteroidales bacterium]
MAVNVGSNCSYTSPESGLTWVADRIYTPGSWGRIGGTGKNSNSFDISVNGKMLHHHFAPAAQNGHKFALRKKYIINSSSNDGIIVNLNVIEGKRLLNSIKLIKL